MIAHLLVMQPIDLCNLNCSYCYLPGKRNSKIMSDDVLQASFKSIFNSSFVNIINKNEMLRVLWHSGEPLLAGMDFYRKAMNYVDYYNVNKVPVKFHVQTNATRINQAWCDFIVTNKMDVSVSIDGPRFINDKYRVNWNGKGSFNLVIKGIDCLKKNNIPLHALCVLTKESLDYPDEIYDFFVEHGFESLGLNIEEQECHNAVSSMNIHHDISNTIIVKYQNFMSRIYDRWVADGKQLKIREFNNKLAGLFRKKTMESFYLLSEETLAFRIITINKDGFVSTFSPELSNGTADNPLKFAIGNVLDVESMDDFLKNENFIDQLNAVKKGVQMCASECAYFDFCGGGGASNKFYENKRFDSTETSYCKVNQKALLDIILDKLQKKDVGSPDITDELGLII